MAKLSPSTAFTTLALTMLDGAFAGKGWQGATLTGALRGLSPRDALWQPAPGRKCIWAHVLHAAYWKHRVLCVFDPAAKEFDRSPSNWPRTPDAELSDKALAAAWKADLALLKQIQRDLRNAVGEFEPSRVTDYPRTSDGQPRKVTFAQFLVGAAAHDCYHLGQIQLIKRLLQDRAS
ncbi:MAG: DinB family protein [Planctomycetota bacterium]